jgi:hypothetical protein
MLNEITYKVEVFSGRFLPGEMKSESHLFTQSEPLKARNEAVTFAITTIGQAIVDQKYDDVVAKIEKGLGGPDNAVSKVIMGYRKFAKEHPIAQGLIYSALIAAAGISGAGLGGAAVLGLLKMTDKLLQGEKFSSAAYSGAKTGAMAYGASKIGDYIKGKMGDRMIQCCFKLQIVRLAHPRLGSHDLQSFELFLHQSQCFLGGLIHQRHGWGRR